MNFESILFGGSAGLEDGTANAFGSNTGDCNACIAWEEEEGSAGTVTPNLALNRRANAASSPGTGDRSLELVITRTLGSSPGRLPSASEAAVVESTDTLLTGTRDFIRRCFMGAAVDWTVMSLL